MASVMTEATFMGLLKEILKREDDVRSCLAANAGKTREEILEAAMATASAKRTVRKVRKEQSEQRTVVALRRKVAEQDFEELLITARALVLCGLPYRKTTKRQISKTARLGNGQELTVIFTAVGKHPLPYGKDRAILGLITTIASRMGSPRVTLGSAMDFLQRLDLGTTGRDYAYLRGAIDRLKSFHCHISTSDSRAEVEVTGNRAVVQNAIVPTKKANQKGVRRSVNQFFVELDASFFKEVQDHGVPIPLEILKPYTNSPVAFDFIVFLNYRIRIARSASRIPLETLCQMLGTEDGNLRKVKQRLEKVLRELREIWPDCPARFDGKGMKACLYVAPPANGRYLVMDKGARAALGTKPTKLIEDEPEARNLA
jgi:hypothetical protein